MGWVLLIGSGFRRAGGRAGLGLRGRMGHGQRRQTLDQSVWQPRLGLAQFPQVATCPMSSVLSCVPTGRPRSFSGRPRLGEAAPNIGFLSECQGRVGPIRVSHKFPPGMLTYLCFKHVVQQLVVSQRLGLYHLFQHVALTVSSVTGLVLSG